MNILMMANYGAPCCGNFIPSLLELAEHVRAEGGNVHFVFPEHRNGGGYSWSAWLEEHGFSVTLIKDGTPGEKVLEILGELIRQHGIQIVHSHFGLYTKLLTLNGKKLGVKVVFHDHMDFSPEGNMGRQRMRALLYSGLFRLQGIHIISVMKLKSQAYSLCGKRFSHYIPNALSLRRNVPVETSREELRAQLGIGPDVKLALVLGYSMYCKGLDMAIKAVEIRRRQDPSVHLAVIGVGTPVYEGAQKWIKEQTGLDARECEWLHFLPSFEDFFALLRAIDVLVSSSRQEAFSYAVLEAISQNTPVALSDVPGTQWATAYEKSVEYPVEDPDACAEAIGKALEMGRRESNAAELVERYGIENWCRAVMDVYRKMLKK